MLHHESKFHDIFEFRILYCFCHTLNISASLLHQCCHIIKCTLRTLHLSHYLCEAKQVHLLSYLVLDIYIYIYYNVRFNNRKFERKSFHKTKCLLNILIYVLNFNYNKLLKISFKAYSPFVKFASEIWDNFHLQNIIVLNIWIANNIILDSVFLFCDLF